MLLDEWPALYPLIQDLFMPQFSSILSRDGMIAAPLKVVIIYKAEPIGRYLRHFRPLTPAGRFSILGKESRCTVHIQNLRAHGCVVRIVI